MRSDKSTRQGAEAALLRTIVAQFSARASHPRGDVDQFELLAGGLIDLLDAECVAGVAMDLCAHAETPPSVVARLFDKGGQCARVAFEVAGHIPAADIFVTAEHGPTEHAAAIARRADLARDVVAALASRGEGEVLRALAGNRRSHLDQAVLRTLIAAARDDLALGRALLDREDLDIDPEPLFLAATRAERVAIVLEACRSVIVAGVFEAAPRADDAFAARLESAALARDRDAMIALLADALDCRKGRVRAIVADPGGEALAFTLIGLGLGEELAIRILLCAEPCISHDPSHMRALVGAMRSIPPRAALRIVAAITGSARHDREPARRAGARDEAFTRATGWRRAVSTRGAAGALRASKLDHSA